MELSHRAVHHRRVVFLGSYPNSVQHFRGDLIRAFVDSGYEVTVMTADAEPECRAKIESLGAEFRPYSILRNAINPRIDLVTLRELRRALKEIHPDVVLAYTIKPVIWGAIAARSCPETRFFALITGLGYAFAGGTLKRRLLSNLVIRLYRFALRRAEAVIFQNSDSRDLFVSKKIVPAGKCQVVNGSGVNLADFQYQPLPGKPPRFLLVARLLGEKGIREYAGAAKIVNRKYPDAIFELVGPVDPSPDGIRLDEIQTWDENGIVKYLGQTDDVRPFISACHVFVLPTFYMEGIPRTILESLSVGRPILTTDAPGCRETIAPGVNGFLVPTKDVEALAERMIWFIENPDQWQAMGDASRKLAEQKFDVHKVNAEMLRIMGI